MSRWLGNLLNYVETKEHGICPFCGSDKVKVDEYEGKRRSSLTFICEKCGKNEHFDGITK